MRTISILLLLQSTCWFGRAFQINYAVLDGASSVAVRKQMTTGARSAGTGMTPSLPSLKMKASANSSDQHERRSFIQNVAQTIVLSSGISANSASALASETGDATDLPTITHKVFMDVRISRADGSFYVRDANPNSDAPDDEPFYGQLVMGLFGNATPEHVRQFLSYVDVRYEVDRPLPSYSRSKFGTLDTSTGLLIGGTIPGLDVTTLAGGNVLEYSGRVIPAKLWMESNKSDSPKLSHTLKGLLTHRNLDPTPSFGITTRSQSTSLDATHTIFGCLLEDKSGFMNQLVDIPVLTDTGRVSRTTSEPVSVGGDVGGSIASSVFTAQRAIFRDAAKTFGDTRLEKVYDGKLLRRVEVTQVGIL